MDSTDQILEFLFDTPPEGAVEYLKSQGYEVSGNADDVIKAIQNHAFTVAKVATADKLQKIHDELKKAMDSGTPYKEWVKSVKDTVPGKTNWQTVYRNNMSSAYNGGRYIEQTANTEYAPFWQHQCVMDSVTRPLGRTLNGLIYRYDDPHWQTMYPPNEHNDRDMIITLSDFYMQNHPELKAEKEPPIDSNGKPYEPAKGFSGNPALTNWKPDLSKYSPEIRSELEKVLGKNAEEPKTKPLVDFDATKEKLNKQIGTRTSENFFVNTKADWKLISEDPAKFPKPDFVSGSGSAYAYTDKGVYRISNHWLKETASCDWRLNFDSIKNTKTVKDFMVKFNTEKSNLLDPKIPLSDYEKNFMKDENKRLKEGGDKKLTESEYRTKRLIDKYNDDTYNWILTNMGSGIKCVAFCPWEGFGVNKISREAMMNEIKAKL